MRNFYTYLPNAECVFELTNEESKTDFLDEVLGSTYLLPHINEPLATGIFPRYVVGHKLTDQEVADLKAKKTKKRFTYV